MRGYTAFSLPLVAFLGSTCSTTTLQTVQVVAAWSPPSKSLLPARFSACRGKKVQHRLQNSNSDQDNDETLTSSQGRRRLLMSALGSAAFMIGSSSQPAAAADDALFRKNPLTNGFFEQVRIWEQAEADNLQYGGELQRGDDGKLVAQTDAYPKLLVPILAMSEDLQSMQSLIQTAASASDPRPSLEKVQEIVAQPKFDRLAFKKVFNAFGDNIYYSDPDRANVYLGGGATPKASQSLAYLYRNDILTNLEDMRAELVYLLKPSTEVEFEDLTGMITAACTAMKEYLSVVPPAEMEKALTLLSES